MSNMQNKKFLLTLTLFVLCSCSSFKEKISSKNLAHVKKIAIISDLGSTLHYHYAGTTAFRNREQNISLDWGLDNLIAKELSTLLKQNPHFVLVDIKGEKFTKKPHFDQLVTAKKSGAKIEPYLEQLLNEGYDGLIIVQAWRQSEDNTIIPGYGIYYDNRLLIHEQNLYLTAKIRVYSAHKKTQLSSIDLLKNHFLSLEHYPKRKKYEEWPAQDLNVLKEDLHKKITTELPQRLSQLGLL